MVRRFDTGAHGGRRSRRRPSRFLPIALGAALLAVATSSAEGVIVRYAESENMRRNTQWHTSGAHSISRNFMRVPNINFLVPLKIWQRYPSPTNTNTRILSSNGNSQVGYSGPGINTFAYCRWEDFGSSTPGYFGFCERTSP